MYVVSVSYAVGLLFSFALPFSPLLGKEVYKLFLAGAWIYASGCNKRHGQMLAYMVHAVEIYTYVGRPIPRPDDPIIT